MISILIGSLLIFYIWSKNMSAINHSTPPLIGAAATSTPLANIAPVTSKIDITAMQNELAKMSSLMDRAKFMLQEKVKKQARISSLTELSRMQRNTLAELEHSELQAEYHLNDLEQKLKTAEATNSSKTETITKMNTVFAKIKEEALCNICSDVAKKPKVVGFCGHILCQDCIDLNHSYKEEQLKDEASIRMKMLAQCCPQCRTQTLGHGFPVSPLNDIIFTCLDSNFITREEEPNTILKKRDYVPLNEVPNQVIKLAYATEMVLAQNTVLRTLDFVTLDDWISQVNIFFSDDISELYFQTYAHYMTGKDIQGKPSKERLRVQLIREPNKLRRLVVCLVRDYSVNLPAGGFTNRDSASEAIRKQKDDAEFQIRHIKNRFNTYDYRIWTERQQLLQNFFKETQPSTFDKEIINVITSYLDTANIFLFALETLEGHAKKFYDFTMKTLDLPDSSPLNEINTAIQKVAAEKLQYITLYQKYSSRYRINVNGDGSCDYFWSG